VGGGKWLVLVVTVVGGKVGVMGDEGSGDRAVWDGGARLPPKCKKEKKMLLCSLVRTL
jgi:hypothetical protein